MGLADFNISFGMDMAILMGRCIRRYRLGLRRFMQGRLIRRRWRRAGYDLVKFT
jgi:hypothetical protein